MGRNNEVGQSHIMAYNFWGTSLCVHTGPGVGSKSSACGTCCTPIYIYIYMQSGHT